MSKKLLIINGGSSSIKYQLLENEDYSLIASGICERIFVDGTFVISYKGEKKELKPNLPNHDTAIEFMLKYFVENKIIENIDDIIGVGHRVVHGGKLMTESKIIDDKIIEQIDIVSKLAPLHNKPELDVIKVAKKAFKNAHHVAVYDTSFHSTIPDINSRYAVPSEWETKYDVKRYGMHGTSHHFIKEEMEKILNKKNPNIIVCHIGNGASICAIKEGKSFNTSMGLTPLEGLIMGTRSGDIDPAIVSYIANQSGLSHNDVTSKLNKESGMFALTNGYSDFRDILARISDPIFKSAFEMYCQKVTNYIVRYLNDLENKCDAIVFTAGVGENVFAVREEVIKRIHLVNIKLDLNKNKESYEEYNKLSTNDSQVPVYAVRTNEELMIAREIKRLTKC
ncbi:MAG: acetate kinase [Mycoplasma sp.]